MVEDWKNYSPTDELVDKAVVVRSVSMDRGYNISEIATATYFVGESQYMDMDVLSVVADPDDLFGDKGIYVTGEAYDEWYLSGMLETEDSPVPNFEMRGRKWEIEGNIEFFEKGDMALNQACGFRIQGAVTR